MDLTNKQKRELKNQKECDHTFKEHKVKDKRMLNGFYIEHRCLKCPTKKLYFKVQIALIIDRLEKDFPMDSMLHPKTFLRRLKEKNYLSPLPTLEEATYLIKNKDKFI